MDLQSITNKKYSFIFGNKSDVGRVREINEDYMESFASSAGHFFVVCDGMGGHTSGEIASRLAVTTIKEYVSNNSGSSKSTKQLLAEAIQTANQTIIDKTIETPEYTGMGTTCVALCIKTGMVYYANVGDSRLYIVRNNKIYQLTKDQSFVQTLIDQGHISYDEAESHPRKNELIQALGITENVVPEINKVGLQIFKGDKFILCSDGLSGFVSDESILSILLQNDVYAASEKLVAAANENGGFDNITVQVVDIIEGDDLPQDLKNVPPLGALDKNITTSNFVRDNKSTRQIPEFDFGNQRQKKKSNKGVLIFTAVFVLTTIILSVYLLIFYKKEEKPIVSNEPPKTNNSTSADTTIKSFFQTIYIGKKAANLKTDEIQNTFSNIIMDSIRYISKSNIETYFNLPNLLKNISEHDLIFIDYDNNSRNLKIKQKETPLLYRIIFETKSSKFILKGIEIANSGEKNDDSKNLKKEEKKDPKKIIIDENKKTINEEPIKDDKKEEPKKDGKRKNPVL